MRKSLFCAAIAIALTTGGTALAQRRAPSGRHGAAVRRGDVVASRGAVTIHSRIAAPVFVRVGPRVYRPPFYRPFGRTAFSFGLYLGYPYSYYPYYPAYAYPYGYTYPYAYPPTYAYPPAYPYTYPYDGSVSAAPTVPDDEAGAAQESPVPAGPADQSLRGSVAIEGAPADATIDVDGNYAGLAADFTGSQPLSEPAGAHTIEIRAPGRRTVIVHLDVQPGRTLTYCYAQ